MQTNARPADVDTPHTGLASAAAMPTPHQSEALRSLILAFSTRAMDVLDAAALLGCSSAYASAYLAQLRDAQVIVIATPKERDTGTRFRLHADTSIVGAYLDCLNGAARERFVFVGRHLSKRGLLVDGRHFHIMRDDLGFVLRISDEPVRRDPLVAALFGDAQAGLKQHYL